MSDSEEHEHEHVEGPAYERATEAYAAALEARSKAGGKSKVDRAAHDDAYVQACADMEGAHGRTSDEALASLFFLARFRNSLADWIVLLDRERERFGTASAESGGTLSWAADALPAAEPRTRTLYRWSIAMSRAATGRPANALGYVDAAVVEGWSPLLAAEVAALVTELCHKTPRVELSELAEELAERLEDEPSWLSAFDFLGRAAEAANLLETLAGAAEDEAKSTLTRAAKKRRSMKPKTVTGKGHPLVQARSLLQDEPPFACLSALTLLEKIPAAPEMLRLPAEQLRLTLSVAVSAGEAAAELDVTSDSDPLPRAQGSHHAAALSAFDLVLRGRAHEAAPLLDFASARLTRCEEAFSWEVAHACAAALGRFEVLDAWLEELRAELGTAPLPAEKELRVRRSVSGPTPDAKRASLLRELYGIDLPGDAHALFEAARTLAPEDPLSAFDPLEIGLVGPFEVLAGLLDERRPAHSMLLHHRYSYHPPEFLPIVSTAEDGLTFGYWLDDWTPSGVDRRFVAWSEEWEPVGRTAADVVRFELERAHAAFIEEYAEASASERKSLDRSSKEAFPFFERARALLVSAGASNDGRVGEDYIEALRAGPALLRAHVATGVTPDFRMGIGCDPGSVKPRVATPALSEADLGKLGSRALEGGQAHQALACGGKLWREGGQKHAETAFRLLDGAYRLIGREGVRRVLHTHNADRWLPSVDLLG